jgi:hypothetical protein
MAAGVKTGADTRRRLPTPPANGGGTWLRAHSIFYRGYRVRCDATTIFYAARETVLL